MLIQPIDYFLVAWSLLAGACTVYVGIDGQTLQPSARYLADGLPAGRASGSCTATFRTTPQTTTRKRRAAAD